MLKFNYRAYLLVCLFLFITMGCDNAMESSIPHARFSLTYNVLQHPKITIPGNFVLVTKNIHGLPVGFGGVILGKSLYSDPNANEYVAYDAACPVEGNKKVTLQIVEDGIGTAVCPQCKTQYNLSGSGYPEGVGTEYLKQYPVQVSGSILNVNN